MLVGRAWHGPCGFSLSSNSQFTPQNPLKLHSRPPPTRFLFLPILSSKYTGSPSAPFLPWVPNWTDAVKERGMRKRRALYTPDNWRVYRSSSRHLLSNLSSRVILSLIPPVFSFTAVAAGLALYNSAVSLCPDFFPLLRASSLPYQLTAPALALLLVFRTEASYSRFVEGRKACRARPMWAVPCRPRPIKGRAGLGPRAGISEPATARFVPGHAGTAGCPTLNIVHTLNDSNNFQELII